MRGRRGKTTISCTGAIPREKNGISQRVPKKHRRAKKMKGGEKNAQTEENRTQDVEWVGTVGKKLTAGKETC